jgi:hypothetical protein
MMYFYVLVTPLGVTLSVETKIQINFRTPRIWGAGVVGMHPYGVQDNFFCTFSTERRSPTGCGPTTPRRPQKTFFNFFHFSLAFFQKMCYLL